ncbi:MAG: IS110 family transposase [Sterolibacteriaceae bacterium MAG5]|nr:IS110 family transposase [Candidatus Nitricoxidireducens bremensis]
MQTDTHPLYLGADIGKDEVVVACSEGSFTPRTIANRRTSLLTFLVSLPPGSSIGMESTGSYHEVFATLAYKKGFRVYLLNPRDARHYAKGVGQRGKTDRVDAQLLARMVAQEHAQLHPWIPPTPEQRQFQRLLKRRAKLSAIRAALGLSLKDLSGFAAERKSLMTTVGRVIERIDERLATLINATQARREAFARLRGIPGVGPVIASGLLAALERLPYPDADAFVAFSGLDPRPDDSGHHRGRRRLSKRGPSELRRLLYLAAMAGARVKVWQPYYERYRAKGLSSTAALVVLARRIARTAWSLYAHKTTFTPERQAMPLT